MPRNFLFCALVNRLRTEEIARRLKKPIKVSRTNCFHVHVASHCCRTVDGKACSLHLHVLCLCSVHRINMYEESFV